MIKLTIRENYGSCAEFWLNFWDYCSQESNGFRGITPSAYIGEIIQDKGGTWCTEGGLDYRQNMWLEFCDDATATAFLLRWS